MAAAVSEGRQLRNLWVREDMARSYGNFELEDPTKSKKDCRSLNSPFRTLLVHWQEHGNFHPFVWLPSLYIEDRYSGQEPEYLKEWAGLSPASVSRV